MAKISLAKQYQEYVWSPRHIVSDSLSDYATPHLKVITYDTDGTPNGAIFLGVPKDITYDTENEKKRKLFQDIQDCYFANGVYKIVFDIM